VARQLGSTRLLTSAAGAIVGTYTYDAYGATSAKTGTVTTALGYTGQYTDSESGLVSSAPAARTRPAASS
jgi:hypothetical protein